MKKKDIVINISTLNKCLYLYIQDCCELQARNDIQALEKMYNYTIRDIYNIYKPRPRLLDLMKLDNVPRWAKDKADNILKRYYNNHENNYIDKF